MGHSKRFLTVSCAIVLVAGCESSSSNTSGDGGDAGGGETSVSPVADGASNIDSGDDGGGLLGTPVPPTPDATITCMGAVDCGGSGHSCCFSVSTFSTMCVTGTCGADYTQCVSSDSECPPGLQCVVSPLGMGVHYCAAGEGGVRDGGRAADADAEGPDASRAGDADASSAGDADGSSVDAVSTNEAAAD